MATWLAVLIGSSLVAISILILAAVIGGVGRHLDGVAHMFFAVSTMQLQIQLDECGYECPDWLKAIDDDEEPLDMPPPTDLKLVKLAKDKKGE
jgi:hypothetical protein